MLPQLSSEVHTAVSETAILSCRRFAESRVINISETMILVGQSMILVGQSMIFIG
jgi:hypothetical protein